MIRIIFLVLVVATIFVVFKYGKNINNMRKIMVVAMFLIAYSLIFYVFFFIEREERSFTPARYENGELIPGKIE